MLILGIETSCDETAAAVVSDGRKMLSNVVLSQVDIHRIYGGVVPELASRNHIEAISGVCREALSEAGISQEQLDAVAVTAAPGLIGALLCGINFAKGFSTAIERPLIGVHHIRAHIAANYLSYPDLKPPFICLVASGGHSVIVLCEDYTKFVLLGQSRDDAAGECLDKVARVLGLPYPGGAALSALAEKGDPKAYPMPRVTFPDAPFDFSFSGVKTAAINTIHNLNQKGVSFKVEDIAASVNDAVADVLSEKLITACKTHKIFVCAAAGGVSANKMLRDKISALCKSENIAFFVPPLSLCGDNAAMVAAQGYFEACAGNISDLTLNGRAVLPVDKVI